MSYIPHSELEKAFKISTGNVDRLLKDAKYLFDQSKYPNSIALTILSYEEVAKLHLIVQRLITKKDITKSEWKQISSAGTHETKLTAIYRDAHAKTQKLSKEQYESIVKSEKKIGSKIRYNTYEEINKASEMITKRLAKLNLIKQYCWYVERTNKEFVTISEIYDKNNLRVLAYYIFKIVHLELLTTLLNKQFPNYWLWTIPREVSILRNHPLYLEIEKIIDEMYSKQFKNISTRAVVMIDTFPKRLEDLPKKNHVPTRNK